MRKIKITCGIFVVATALILPTVSYAQGLMCSQRGGFQENLRNIQKEVLRFHELNANGDLLEVYASDTGEWSIILTSPGGISCLFDFGKYFETVEPKEPPKEENPT